MHAVTESSLDAGTMTAYVNDRHLSATTGDSQHDYVAVTPTSETCFHKFIKCALGWCRGRTVTVSSIASENQLRVCMHWSLPQRDHEAIERLHSAVTDPSKSKKFPVNQTGANTGITYSNTDTASDDTLRKALAHPSNDTLYMRPLSSHELQIQLREEIARDLARYCSLMCDELPSKCATRRNNKKHSSCDFLKPTVSHGHSELSRAHSCSARRVPVTTLKGSGAHSCAAMAHRRMTISQTPIYPQKSNPAILIRSHSVDLKRTF